MTRLKFSPSRCKHLSRKDRRRPCPATSCSPTGQTKACAPSPTCPNAWTPQKIPHRHGRPVPPDSHDNGQIRPHHPLRSPRRHRRHCFAPMLGKAGNVRTNDLAERLLGSSFPPNQSIGSLILQSGSGKVPDCKRYIQACAPIAPTIACARSRIGAWRSLVSARVLGTRGRRFESGRPDQDDDNE